MLMVLKKEYYIKSLVTPPTVTLGYSIPNFEHCIHSISKNNLNKTKAIKKNSILEKKDTKVKPAKLTLAYDINEEGKVSDYILIKICWNVGEKISKWIGKQDFKIMPKLKGLLYNRTGRWKGKQKGIDETSL